MAVTVLNAVCIERELEIPGCTGRAVGPNTSFAPSFSSAPSVGHAGAPALTTTMNEVQVEERLEEEASLRMEVELETAGAGCGSAAGLPIMGSPASPCFGLGNISPRSEGAVTAGGDSCKPSYLTEPFGRGLAAPGTGLVAPCPPPSAAGSEGRHAMLPAVLATDLGADSEMGHRPQNVPAAGPRGPGRLTDVPPLDRYQVVLLVGLLVAVMAAEVCILGLTVVPWLLDKLWFAVSLLFQAAMLAGTCYNYLNTGPGGASSHGVAARAVPLHSPCSSSTDIACAAVALCATSNDQPSAEASSAGSAKCNSLLLDLCHWAYVVMTFGGAAVLRAPESLAIVASIAAISLALRYAMRHQCIITALARRTSLPDIPGTRVTAIFAGLLVVTLLRLSLQAEFGRGFPIDQILAAVGLTLQHRHAKRETVPFPA